MIEAFLQKFMLSDQHIQLLTTSYSIDSAFFDALQHLERVNAGCRQLLTFEHNQTANDIMDVVKHCQDVSFDRLYKWTQSQILYMKVESPEISKELRQAMNALKSRPILFQSIVEEIASIRKTNLTQSFIHALTRGGPHGLPRPIELQAHDPIRYVGDMLAWVHQATASEHDMLQALFNLNAPSDFARRNSEQLLQNIPELTSDSISVSGSLEKHMEGLHRPLKSRVDQVFASSLSCVVLYRLANMVQFYAQTIEKIMGSKASMYTLIHEYFHAF
jgi:hypothetical protein